MHWHRIDLTEKELKELRNAERQVEKPQLLKRLQCVQLKGKKWKHKDVSDFLGIRPETVSVWLQAYKTGGIDELLKWNYKGKVSILTVDDQQKIKERNKVKSFSTAKEAKAYIKKEFGIDWHLHWVQKLMKKNFDFHSRSRD